MQIEMIINKLPIETQTILNSPMATKTSWSPEWDNWAKNAISQCNIARDNGIITTLEWQILRKNFFKKLGGIIGTMPYSNNLEFMDFLFYEKD